MTPEQFVALGDIVAEHFNRFAAQLEILSDHAADDAKVCASLLLSARGARESAEAMKQVHRNLMQEDD